jgi:2-aminoadipate transaminase
MQAYKVAYVAGEGFFTDGNGLGSDCMRVSFGGVSPENIRMGTKRLGEMFRSKL